MPVSARRHIQSLYVICGTAIVYYTAMIALRGFRLSSLALIALYGYIIYGMRQMNLKSVMAAAGVCVLLAVASMFSGYIEDTLIGLVCSMAILVQFPKAVALHQAESRGAATAIIRQIGAPDTDDV